MATPPTCRWGILTTGFISTWFVEDLLRPRAAAKATHVIAAIGASSVEKGRAFAAQMIPPSHSRPTIYGDYHGVYADPAVDCVYVGTPHAFHKQNCLDAIAAGKNVLCEKAFTLNAREAQEVLDAARAKGVYVAEAMWLRHRPLVQRLQEVLYVEQAIGPVFRTRSDFGFGVDLKSLPATSRYKDPRLGAGSLLDIGIYALTWALLTLDPGLGRPGCGEMPQICAVQTFEGEVEVTTSALLRFSTGRQGIVTSSTMASGDPRLVATIEGTNGYVEVEGPASSLPTSFTVYPKRTTDLTAAGGSETTKIEGKKYEFDNTARGFVFEADNTALDIAAGRKESTVMPLSETLLVMQIMDEIRRQGGTKYPQDTE